MSKRYLIAAQRPNVPGAFRVTRRRNVPPVPRPTVSPAQLVMSMNGGS